MANKKVYYNDEENENEGMSELQIFKDDKGGLFVSLVNMKTSNEEYVSITKEDAIELISELAFEFDLVNDDLEYPRPMWEGNPR